MSNNTDTLTKTVATEHEAIPAREFSYHDRCDRCGHHVQAYYVATKGNMEISLCGHHGEARNVSGKTHVEALELAGWTVLDFTDRLDQPLVSANVD